MRLLLIEDDALLGDGVRAGLRQAGFEVDWVRDGADAAQAAEAEEAFAAIVLDLSAVDYISSVGLRVLMLAAKQVKSQGGSISVAALQPVVREIFEISRFNLVIPSYAGVDDALAAHGAG